MQECETIINEIQQDEEIQQDIAALSKEISLLSREMGHDTFLSIITAADVVNRYLVIKLRRARSHSTRYAILNALVTHGGNMTPMALSKATFRSKYDITRVVDKLQRDGLVERHSSNADHRVKNITITPKGIDFIRKTIPERREIAFEVTSFLNQEEMEALGNILRRLRKHLSNMISGKGTGAK